MVPLWLGRLIYNASFWVVFWLFTFGWGIRVGGRRTFPRRGSALVVSNHQSFLDPILIGLGAPRYLTYLARSNLFDNAIGAAIIRIYGAVPIERGYGREGLQTVFQELDQGKAVLMFPEGERTHDGQVHELKAGVSLIVKRTDAWIVPCGVAGIYETLPRHRKYPRWSPLWLLDNGCSIGVVFGEPIPGTEFQRLSRETILSRLQHEIEVCYQAAERLRRKPKSEKRTAN